MRRDPVGLAILAALMAWTLAPIAYLVYRSVAHDLTITGAESLFGIDQLQYLAWVRSQGEHGLAANGFDLRLGDHVFAHPMFTLSGLAWRAGLSLPATLFLWAPVAAGVLFAGFRAYVHRTVEGRWARPAALFLALFFVTPAYAVLSWPDWPGAADVSVFAGELAPTGALWGYLPAVIAMGLMPPFLLGVERLMRGAPDRTPARLVAGTAAVGLLVSWLHPWQGETLLLIVAVVVLWGREWRSLPRLAVPLAATVAPLLYYALLARADAAWDVARLQTHPERPSLLALAVVLAPFALALAARRPDVWSVRERILYVWPAAALAIYLLPIEQGYFLHALEAMSLPLGVLAVRGWQRLRWPAWAAAAALAVCSVPGLVYAAHREREAILSPGQVFLVTAGEARALSRLEAAPGDGGVLASPRIASVVPALTGRRVWAGHPTWTEDFPVRIGAAAELFHGDTDPRRAQRLVRGAGVRYVLADCTAPRDLRPLLGRLVVVRRRHGCATLYVLRVSAPPARF
ncbi:MAG TPA: hypothetical protein VNB64_12410 [Solirubrobacteraceae bacterium]|nr:hypothetical protein [Solirubrobacteraceae bacterium]